MKVFRAWVNLRDIANGKIEHLTLAYFSCEEKAKDYTEMFISSLKNENKDFENYGVTEIKVL